MTDAIRARHVVDPAVPDRCLRDVQDWPCDTAIVLVALDGLTAVHEVTMHRYDAALARERRLRELVESRGHEYEVDGRQEWHSVNCLYRKTWAMGGEDEPFCIESRAALKEVNDVV